MKVMSKLMALAILNNEYTLERVPSRLKKQVEEQLTELEGDF